jgi:hypothetical protein
MLGNQAAEGERSRSISPINMGFSGSSANNLEEQIIVKRSNQ